MNRQHHVSRNGFSLIEVLIAVAVLSFGLLALASLQSSLIRSSAETKARSVGLSLAKDRVEDMRAYRTMADYFALTDGAATATDAVEGLGGVDYTITTTVNRFAFNGDPDNNPATDNGAFQAVGVDTGPLAGNFVAANEFKQISVNVAWTDANGLPQSVVIEDAIGSLPPENTGRLARRKGDPRYRGPEVLIGDPSLDQGVIPIAIGDGSETAATNPRPDVDTGVTLQTSFDIFTYSALNDGATARAQSRVETSVIGCRCDFGQASTTAVDFRPTYWDGLRYVVPKAATGYSVQAGEANLGSGDPAQSVLCTTCCRDHHDPGGVAGPQFSPRRGDHTHFLDDISGPGVTSGQYHEACRMIRVDGIFRVAADPYNEYTNILKTATKSGSTDPFTAPPPDGDASASYVDFVIDYLSTAGSQSDPNQQLTQTVADAKAETAGLNPVDVVVEIGDERWMHARGLYVDYLEVEAIEAIDESQQDCPSVLTDTECLLRVLPFTSINLTELSEWTPKVQGVAPIFVANNDFVDSTLSTFGSQDPVRGRVTADIDGTADATAEIRTSNTGLLANVDYIINPDERVASTNNIGDQPDSDGQTFTIQGPACGASPSVLTIDPRGGIGDFVSSDKCEGSDATKPVSATRIRLDLRLGDGPDTVSIQLIAPDNTVYTVASNVAWSSLASTYSFDAAGDPTLLGFWTLRVTNEDSGQAVDTRLGFGVTFLYTAPFTAELAGYSFVGTTFPSISLSVGGGCDPLSTTNNPTDCVTTAPDVAGTILTLGTYNYQVTGASQDAPCPGLTTGTTCPTVNHCLNYDVSSATLNGDATDVAIGTAASSGKNENTPIKFGSGLSADDQVLITLSAGAETMPACTPKKQGNNQVCPASTSITCQ